MMKLSADSVAGCIARVLKARGVERVFALCGGHIMPIWMRLDAEGIRIIDVRDERAAVHMAQAHAELTGELGVALVTAGPGVTNAMTGIANAHVSRAPVLVLSGTPPRAAGEPRRTAGYRAHDFWCVRITRYARTVREPTLVLAGARRSRSRGPSAKAGSRDRPTSTSRPTRCAPKCRRRCSSTEHFAAEAPRRSSLPDPAAVDGLSICSGRRSECW